MKLKHSSVVFFSCFSWLGIGMVLAIRGAWHLLQVSIRGPFEPAKMRLISLFPSKEVGFIVVILAAFTLGFLKARYVLIGQIKRAVSRLLQMENPLPISKAYSVSYYFLVLGMVGIGLLLSYFAPLDIRAFISIFAGIALINGSFIYFHFAKAVKDLTEPNKES
jgi:hypothetical protein